MEIDAEGGSDRGLGRVVGAPRVEAGTPNTAERLPGWEPSERVPFHSALELLPTEEDTPDEAAPAHEEAREEAEEELGAEEERLLFGTQSSDEPLATSLRRTFPHRPEPPGESPWQQARRRRGAESDATAHRAAAELQRAVNSRRPGRMGPRIPRHPEDAPGGGVPGLPAGPGISLSNRWAPLTHVQDTGVAMGPAENTNAARVASRGRGGAGGRGGTGRRQQRGATDGNGGGPRGRAGHRPSRDNPANRREPAGGPGASASAGRPRGGVRAGDRVMPRARRPRASRRPYGPGDSDAGSSTSGSSRVNPRTSGTPHRPHRRADAAGEMGAAGVGLPEQTSTGQTPVVANRQIRFPRWARRGRSPRLRTHTPTDPTCPFPTQPGEWHPLQPPEERRPAEAAANTADQNLFSRRTATHPAHQGATPRRRRR